MYILRVKKDQSGRLNILAEKEEQKLRFSVKSRHFFRFFIPTVVIFWFGLVWFGSRQGAKCPKLDFCSEMVVGTNIDNHVHSRLFDVWTIDSPTDQTGMVCIYQHKQPPPFQAHYCDQPWKKHFNQTCVSQTNSLSEVFPEPDVRHGRMKESKRNILAKRDFVGR